jgi:hypothetical protein
MEEMDLNKSLDTQTNDLYNGTTEFNEYFPLNNDSPTVTNLGVQNYVSGAAPGNIPSQVPKTPAYNFEDHKRAVQNDMRQSITQNSYDPSAYIQIQKYDSGMNSSTFYDRYAKTGLENIDLLGFHPTKDNETAWNENTSWTSDFSRMIANSFGTLAYEGFVSGPNQLMRWVNGDDFFSSDREAARNYERASAIGYSTRGGAGAFTNNLVMNFGYTAGIIGEIVAEEIAAAIIAPLTGGASTAAVTANAARRLNTLGDIATGAPRVAKTFDFAMDGAKQFRVNLDELNDINNARKTYDGVQTSNKMLRGESFFSNPITKALNPLSQTTSELYDIYRAQDNIAGLASLSKTAGAFYRDIRTINMARSESSLEAGMVQNKVFSELYNQYYAENGVAASNDEMRNMMVQAQKAGIETSMYNFPLIYATNKVTFSNLLSKGKISNYVNQTIKELGEVDAGRFGKLGKVAYNQSTRQFEFMKSGLKNWWKGWRTDPVYKSVGKTVGYFKANIAEGLQETYQEVVADAAERYYVESYDSDLVSKQLYKNAQMGFLNIPMSEFGESAKKYNPFGTSEGLDVFASGFAMGFLGGGLDKAINYTFVQANRLTNPKQFQKYKEKKLEITRDLVNNLNAQGVSGFINSRILNAGVQSKLANAKRKGSKKEIEDAEDEAFISHFTTLSENGVLGQYLDGLMSMNSLTDQEFVDAMDNSITVDQVSKTKQKIATIVDRAKKLESRYNYYKEKYPNPVDLNLFEKGVSEDYTEAYIMNQAWEYATKSAVFFNESFENTMKRMKDIVDLQYQERPVSKMTKRQSDVLFVPKQLANEIGLLQNEIDALSELKDPASKELLTQKKKQLVNLQNYKDKFDAFDRYYHRGRYLEGVKQKLSSERGGVEVTNEEASAYILEQLGIDEVTEEKELKLISELETEYKNYLRGIADVEDDYIFTENIDKSFERLLDYYKLDNESRSLAEAINLLNDPQGYINLVERNKQWMTDLYAKRSAYYEKVVKSEIEKMENNALLNALANKGVFVSLDDFKKWMDFRIPPKEFYDQSRGIVIPEGSPTYEGYYALFDELARASQEKSTEIVEETMDIALKNELQRLDNEKAAKIKTLPKTTVRETVQEVLPTRGKTMGIRRIAGQTSPGQYVDAIYMDQDVEETLTFYKDSEGNLFNVVDGNITTPVNSKLAYQFTKAEVYTFTEKPDQVVVDNLEKEYEELKNTVKERYANAKKNLKEEANKEVIYTPDTDLDEMPNDLKKELYDLFQKEELSKLSEDVRVNMKYQQEQNLFVKFIQSSLSAKAVIDSYNKKQKAVKATTPTGEKAEFTFKFLGKEINTKDLTAVELRSYQRRLKQTINGLTAKQKDNTITPEEKTELANAKVVSVDIEKLIKTRSKNELSPELQEAVKKVEDIEAKQEDILTTELGVIVDNIVHRPVTQVTIDSTQKDATDVEAQKTDIEKRRRADVLNAIPEDDEFVIYPEQFDQFNREGDEAPKGSLSGKDIEYNIQQAINEEIEYSKNITGSRQVSDAIFTKGKIPKLQKILANVKEINAKYDAELAAMQPTNIETQKADIERRRNKSRTIDSQPFQRNNATGANSNFERNSTDIKRVGLSIDKKINNGKTDNEIIQELAAQGIVAMTNTLDRFREFIADRQSGKTTQTFEEWYNETVSDIDAELAALGESTTTAPQSTANESLSFINEQLDNLFTKDVTPVFDSTKISQEAFDSLFGENGIFTTLKKREENGEIYITSRNLKVYDTDLRLAGQIDLLVADTKKNLTIVKVDLRTKAQWNAFNKKENDQLLPQTLNANLLQRMTGVSPKIALMPIEIITDKSGKITSAAKPSRENLLDTEFLITLDKGLAKDAAEAIVPAVKQAPETQPTVEMPVNAESSSDQQSPAIESEGAEVTPEMAYVPENERITAADIEETLKSVTTEPQLLKLKIQVNLDIAQGKILPEDIDKITEMLDNKDITLSEEIEPKISPDNMVKGTQLVAKSLIFTDKNQTEVFADQDDTVVISSTNKKENTVTVKPLGKKISSMKFTRDELNNLFIEKEAVMEAKDKPTTKPDKESKANVVDTIDAVDTFVADQDALSDIEKQADKKSLKDLDSDLLDDLDC